MSPRCLAFLCMGVLLLAGCGGGSAPSIPAAGAGFAAPASAKARKAKIALRVRIPKKRVRRGGRDRYVSPSTQAMTVAFTGGPTAVNETVGLTPTSGGCQSELASTVCQFTVAVAPGNYTAQLQTYDQVIGCPACTIPAGANELSVADVAVTVKPGVANELSLTLSGIPVSVAVLPLGSNSVLNVGQGIDLLGMGAHRLLAEALDADGNIIFGAGSPTFDVQTSGSLAIVVKQSQATPNIITVTPPSAFSSAKATLTVTASFTGQATNGCQGTCPSRQVTVDLQGLLATYSFSNAFIYETGQTNPLAQLTLGLNNPVAIAFDQDANLYVANCLVGCNFGSSPDTIAVFAPPYTGAPTYVTDGLYGPVGLAVYNGELFVTNNPAYSLDRAASIAIYSLPLTASSAPIATNFNGLDQPPGPVAFDSSGNLYVVNANQISEYASPYTGNATALDNGALLSDPTGIAIDGSNDVFVTSDNFGTNGFLTEYAAPGYTTAIEITQANDGTTFKDPAAIAADLGGTNVLLADKSNNAVFECGPPFSNGSPCGSGSTISTSVKGPVGLIEDAFGNLYVGNNGGTNATTDITQYAAGAFGGAATPLYTNGYEPIGMAVLP